MSAVTYYYWSISALILLQLNPVVFVFLFLFFQGLACQNSSTGWDRAQSCPSFWGEEAWRCAKAPVCRKTWRDSAASMTSLSLSATSQLTSRGKTVLVSCRQIYAFSWFNWERPFFFSSSPHFMTSQTSPDIAALQIRNSQATIKCQMLLSARTFLY